LFFDFFFFYGNPSQFFLFFQLIFFFVFFFDFSCDKKFKQNQIISNRRQIIKQKGEKEVSPEAITPENMYKNRYPDVLPGNFV